MLKLVAKKKFNDIFVKIFKNFLPKVLGEFIL